MYDDNYLPEADFKRVEFLLIQSITTHLEKDGITALNALNVFYKHYCEVSLEELYFSSLKEKVSTLPDGQVFLSISDVFDHSSGQPKSAYRQLRLERHFYGYYEDEVIELRLFLRYERVVKDIQDRSSFYITDDNILTITENEWFQNIMHEKPLQYKVDVNFNA